MNKRGAIVDIVVFVVMTFIITIFIGIWLFGFDTLTTTLEGIDTSIMGNPDNNISSMASDTFGQVNSANKSVLPTVAFALIFGMVLTIFIANFLIRVHPVFFFVYLAFTVLAIILSVNISNAYETMLTGQVFSSQLQAMTASTFILLNLPIVVTVVGFIGIVILFAGIVRDKELGGVV